MRHVLYRCATTATLNVVKLLQATNFFNLFTSFICTCARDLLKDTSTTKESQNFVDTILPAVGLEPRMGGWEEQTLPLCHAVPILKPKPIPFDDTLDTSFLFDSTMIR